MRKFLTKLYQTGEEKFLTDEIIALGVIAAAFLSIYTAFAALLGLTVYLAVKRRLRDIIGSSFGGWLLLTLPILSLFVSAIYQNTQGMLIAVAMAGIFIAALFFRSICTRYLFDQVSHVSGAMSLFCLLVALLQILVHGSGYRAVSTFMNANYYAAIAEMMVLLSVFQLLQNGSRRRKGFYLAVMIANLVGLYLTDCRTAWLVLALSLPLLLLLLKRYKLLAAYLAGGAILAVCFFCMPSIFPRIGELDEDMDKRLSIWVTAAKGIKEHLLFGQGGLTYSQIYASLGGHPAPHAHNLLLDFILNFGLVGAILVLPFLRGIFRSVRSLRKADESEQPLAALVLSMGAMLLLHGMTDVTFFWPQTALPLLFVIGSVGMAERPSHFRYLIRQGTVVTFPHGSTLASSQLTKSSVRKSASR